MKAFISYSVNDNNQYIITLLSSKLRQKGFGVTTSQNFYSQALDYSTQYEIRAAQLFVGVITDSGNERKRVLDEWNYAIQTQTPNLLLIENTVPVHENFTGNFVRFNRQHPQAAIQEINRRMQPAKVGKKGNDALPWVLGGAALLAIIGLLSSKT